MGATCSKYHGLEGRRRASKDHLNGGALGTRHSRRQDSPDPAVYDLMRRSVACSTMPDDRDDDATKAAAKRDTAGQHHLLYKYQRKENKNANSNGSSGGSHNNNHNGGDSNSTSDPALPSSPQETNPTMDSSQEEEDNSMRSNSSDDTSSHLILDNKTHLPPTRLLVRRHSLRYHEEGLSGTHIYAIRYPHDQPLLPKGNGEGKESGSSASPVLSQEQAQPRHVKKRWIRDKPYTLPSPTGEPINVDHLFRPSTMAAKPKQQVLDWVTVSQEHSIYIADVGLTPAQCNQIVQVTEQQCRGNYAAYTYAKQTLGCREFPTLAAVCQPAIHTMTNFILEFSQKQEQVRKEKAAATGNVSNGSNNSKCLALDDREPHMVKYDVTKKERQKLDMHTDKSEWTFLIALSNGSGMDYEGGGTYFECLDATVHIQRGHALCFPGKLRHCGQRITSGLRFLLVAFLVDKSTAPPANANGGSGGGSSQKEVTSGNNSSAGTTTASGAKSIINANKRETEDQEDDLAYRTA